jgi:glycosyltransferase involved in cell wall biosynthesis
VNTPRVSAVIPVHNGERFIAASIRSVLRQTEAVHECIVVDDGSTDGTQDVVRSFGDSVRLIRQTRCGVAAARNAGIESAAGTHIALLDADDVWLANKLERQLALMKGDDLAAVLCGYAIADEELKPLRVISHRHVAPALERAMLVEAPGVGLSFTGLMTRGVIKQVGHFDERLSVSADLEFAWRLTRHCRVGTVDEALVLHRRHSHGQMHHDLATLVRDMNLVIDAAEAGGMSGRAVRRARTNLRIYAAWRMLGASDVVSGGAQALGGLLRSPTAPIRLAVRFAAQRTRQHRACARFSRRTESARRIDEPLGALPIDISLTGAD